VSERGGRKSIGGKQGQQQRCNSAAAAAEAMYAQVEDLRGVRRPIDCQVRQQEVLDVAGLEQVVQALHVRLVLQAAVER
jgi:hypothetical protein